MAAATKTKLGIYPYPLRNSRGRLLEGSARRVSFAVSIPSLRGRKRLIVLPKFVSIDARLPDMDGMSRWLWYANVTALIVLLVRLAIIRLYRIYPFLFAYFLVETGGSIVLTQMPYRSNSYALTYMALRSVVHIVTILVVFEMYRVALARHAGLAGFGRASILAVILVTLLVAAAGAVLDKDILSGQSALVHRFFTLERTLDLVILAFLLIMAGFLTWFPVELSRNTAFSMGGFLAFYFTRAAGLLAANLLPRASLTAVSNVLLGASLLILLAWIVLLRSERPDTEPVTGHAWDPAALARVSRRLDAINAALLRFGRR